MRINDIQLTEFEKSNYIFDEPRDYKILIKVKKLEEKNLNKHDKEVTKLIKTQLKEDWREGLIKFLNKLLKKYQ